MFAQGSLLDARRSPVATQPRAGHGTLCVGDAIATYAVTTGRSGPQLSPFSEDRATALASLARFEDVDARLVLPGHGPGFAGTPAEAVRLAREATLPA